ncbi:IZH family channel protein [Mycena kentingensis (nom. inval.)]|nr:IZH family channel protein [Mycena kentingensis (nom. inval.)]
MDMRPPRLHRRRMSAPPPRPAPTRLPQCRLPPSLDALDLSPASPSHALARIRLLVLSYLEDLESRLESRLAQSERVTIALDLLHSIREEVRSHIPDLGAHVDDLKSRLTLPDIEQLKSLISGLELSQPLSYVPKLSERLRKLHAHISDADLTFDWEFSAPSFDFEFSFDLPDLADVLDAFRADIDAFLADLPQLPSLPTSLSFPSLPATLSRASSSISATLSPSLVESSDEEKMAIAHTLALSAHGTRLITYDQLPLAWRNNAFVRGGYRFIPLSNWPALVLSVFRLHNETLNIHTHLIPLVLWGLAFAGIWVAPGWNSLLDQFGTFLMTAFAPLAWMLPSWLSNDLARYTPFSAFTAPLSVSKYSLFSSPYPPLSPDAPPDPAENLFTLFALACLACSVLWHVMAGCAHRGTMETCARIDYVGIGWLIATSIATVVHYGYACAEAAVDATTLGHKVLHPSEILHHIQTHIPLHRAAVPSPTAIPWADQIDTTSDVLPEVFASALSIAISVLSSALLGLSDILSALYDATIGQAKALLQYHPFGAACLLLCFVCGVSGNILPFCEWFNRVENRLWRLGFFVGISFSALAPLGGIAALQGWETMFSFMAPVAPSLLFYVAGIVVYATQFPECFLPRDGSKNRVLRFLVDRCGAGSHAIWHVFIVFAIRAHRDGIREMRRVAEEGGCASGLTVGW